MAFSHFGNYPSTPRRSPRLLTRHSKQPSVTILTHVRNHLKRFVEGKKEKSASQSEIEQSFQLEKLKYYVAVEEVDTYSSLSVELVKADVGNNTLKYFLLITRKLKSYDEQLGPYDALRLIVGEDGSYKLLSHGRALEESVVTPPFNASCILQTLSQLEPDEPWVVCPGIRGYSAYRESIGFDIKRVVTGNCPPDSVRDRECTILYKQQSTTKPLIEGVSAKRG